MNLEPINSAMQAAFDAALVNPVKQAPTQVGDDPNQTVQTVVYEAPTGSGFRIVGRIKVGNYTATKVLNHGPDTASVRDWPAEGIEAAATAHVARCIEAGKQHVTKQGYSADEKVICLNALLKAKETDSLASHPKLVAVYTWMETVQAMAVAGQNRFPVAPHTFEETVQEAAFVLSEP
jgi:hypothetical protein